MARQSDVHIVATPAGAGWCVRKGGRTLSRHRTQRRAIAAAKKVGRRSRADVVTHGRNGRIRSKDSYGNETGARDTER